MTPISDTIATLTQRGLLSGLASRGRLIASGLMLSLAATSFQTPSYAGEPIYIEPLFEYPTPPEELEGLAERSDYLMDHFWDSFDFADPGSVDQNALNAAFGVYATAMRYASRDKALASVANLVKQLKGNPVRLFQFTKSAEDNLYGPRAPMWSDEAYMPFLKAITDDKNLSDTRRQRYAMQYDLLSRNAIGARFPQIKLTTRGGRRIDWKPTAPLTVIEFGDPDCEDCAFARTKLEMATDVADMIARKEIEMLFVVPDAVPDDQSLLLEKFASYPEQWLTAICYGGDDIFDLRVTPCFYIIDAKGRILAKNLDAADTVDMVRNLKADSKKK